MTREQDLLRANNDLLLRARAAEQKLENFIPEIRDQKKAMDIASTLLAYLGTLPIDPARGVAANQILVEIEALVHTLTQRFEKVIAIPENEEQAKAMALYGYRFLKDAGVITEEQCGSIEDGGKSLVVEGVAYPIDAFRKAVEIMKGMKAKVTGSNDLKLTRKASDAPSNSHGGPCFFVTWQLEVGGITIMSDNQRSPWGDAKFRDMQGAAPPADLLLAYEAISDMLKDREGTISSLMSQVNDVTSQLDNYEQTAAQLDADSDEHEAEIRAAFMAGWLTNAAPTTDEREIEYQKGCEEVDYNGFSDLGFQIYVAKLAADNAEVARENDDMADEIHIVLQDVGEGEHFVEIEDRNGRSISIGERRNRPDGYSAIVIKNTDIARAVMSRRIDTQDEVLVDLTTDAIIKPEPVFNFSGGVSKWGEGTIIARDTLPEGTTIASGIIGPTHLNFGGIQIELKTGNIKLPDDITINEASRTIWDGIRAHILHDMQPPVLYRHHKRSGRYELLGLAEAQIAKPHRVYDELMNQRADSRLLTEGDTMTVYRAQDGGKLYIRFPDEFSDGRFSRVHE